MSTVKRDVDVVELLHQGGQFRSRGDTGLGAGLVDVALDSANRQGRRFRDLPVGRFVARDYQVCPGRSDSVVLPYCLSLLYC